MKSEFFEFMLDLVLDWDNIPVYLPENVPEEDILDMVIDILPDPTPAEYELLEVCLHPDALVDVDSGRIALEDKRMDYAANIMLDLAASYPVWGGRTIFGALTKVVK